MIIQSQKLSSNKVAKSNLVMNPVKFTDIFFNLDYGFKKDSEFLELCYESLSELIQYWRRTNDFNQKIKSLEDYFRLQEQSGNEQFDVGCCVMSLSKDISHKIKVVTIIFMF